MFLVTESTRSFVLLYIRLPIHYIALVLGSVPRSIMIELKSVKTYSNCGCVCMRVCLCLFVWVCVRWRGRGLYAPAHPSGRVRDDTVTPRYFLVANT